MKRKRWLVLVLSLILVLGLYGFILFSATYSPHQLQKVAGSYLGSSLGQIPADSRMVTSKQCNQDLFCLFEAGDKPYLVGFHPSALAVGRYRPFCLSACEQMNLKEFFMREGELCTYVLFGKRPQELDSFSVDVLDEQGETINQFFYAPKEEDAYLLYVLQKSYPQPVTFRPSIDVV